MSQNDKITYLRLAHSGDVGDTRQLVLGGVADLDDVTALTTHLSRGANTATLTTTVLDSATRTVEVELGGAPADWLPAGPVCGLWTGKVHLEFSDGAELSWPNAPGSQIGIFVVPADALD